MQKYRSFLIFICTLISFTLLLQFSYIIQQPSSSQDEINDILLDEVSSPNIHSKPLPLKPCNIVIAHGPDPHAVTATLIWLYPINFLIYSERNHMTLWIDFKNDYNKHCYDPKMGHENVWNYYLYPIDPITS